VEGSRSGRGERTSFNIIEKKKEEVLESPLPLLLPQLFPKFNLCMYIIFSNKSANVSPSPQVRKRHKQEKKRKAALGLS
jgi:hypothetical protein